MKEGSEKEIPPEEEIDQISHKDIEDVKTYEDILQYISYKSRKIKNPVSDSLISFLMNIQYDKEAKRFYFQSNQSSPEEPKDKIDFHDAELPKEKTLELIKKILHLLLIKGDGIVETLKLQITYELSHIEEEDKIEKIKQYFDNELNSILKEITQTQSSNKDTENFAIHKKIYNYLLIKTKQNTLSSLIHEKDASLGQNAEKEIYLALDSVFPKSGLTPFLSLSTQDKIAQLNELSNTIMGIRLLNCELGKGGIGLMALEDIKKKLKFDLIDQVKSLCEKIKVTCDKYSLVYDHMDIEIVSEENELKVLEKIKKMIVFYRQILVYLSMLIDDLNYSNKLKNQYIEAYDQQKNALIEIISHQSSVSKERSYPLFQSLAQYYIKFQEQVFILESRENVFQKLKNFIENAGIKMEYDENEWEGCFRVEVERLDIYEKMDDPVFSFEPGEYQNGINLIAQNQTEEFLNINLEYQGFCICSLLNKNGLVLGGIPQIVVKYHDKYMVFCSHNCVKNFIDSPQEYLNKLNEYVKENPHLINLLHMVDDFPIGNLSDMFRNKESLTYQYKNSKLLIDEGTQTPDHIVEKFIDPDYVWNEWDLKKKALQLADIMTKKTVSCQTLLSHFRRENETQVWPLKESCVNTTVNKGTNLSIPKNYAVGFKANSKEYKNYI